MEVYYDERVLSGYRIKRIVRERLKTLAKVKKTSVNELVDETLTELTKNIRTPEEIKEEKKRTENFLSACMNKWENSEFNECIDAINETRKINEPIKL